LAELAKFQKADRKDCESYGDSNENDNGENLSDELKAGELPV
jgi:hypothetical protein